MGRETCGGSRRKGTKKKEDGRNSFNKQPVVKQIECRKSSGKVEGARGGGGGGRGGWIRKIQKKKCNSVEIVLNPIQVEIGTVVIESGEWR